MELIMFWVLLCLFVKHYICDFPLQAFAWTYLHKGKYGHPGGLVHSGLHGAGTFIVFSFWLGFGAIAFALVDFLVHYHVDWLKAQVERFYKLTPTTNVLFWTLMGFDQLLHHLTYFVLVYFAFI